METLIRTASIIIRLKITEKPGVKRADNLEKSATFSQRNIFSRNFAVSASLNDIDIDRFAYIIQGKN